MEPSTRDLLIMAAGAVGFILAVRTVGLRLLKGQLARTEPPVPYRDLPLHEQVAVSHATYEANAAAWDQDRSEPNDDLFPHFQAACPGGLVLDLGCGNGCDAPLFGPEYRYVGLDRSAALLGLAQRNQPDRSFVRGDLMALPFADASFDGVWSCYVLSHVPSLFLPAALRELRRVLRTGGVASITTNLGGGEGVRRDELGPKYITEYSHSRFEKLLIAAGFRIIGSGDNADAVPWTEVAHMSFTVEAE